ncbi:MAG: DegT/DnrJ/EryC1/StrS family aminotransferase [bacterium]
MKSAAKAEKKQLAAFGGKPELKKMPVQKIIIDENEYGEVLRVLKSGHLNALTNDVVGRFERKFAEWNGAKYGIAVNSGTAALHVALAALDVGPGDEVIVPPYTFIATASAVLQQNAVPVFADIDPRSLNMDPAQLEKKITSRTRAIIPVHLFGMPADMDSINRIARKHKIPVIEDACQAHGAIYKGKKVGTLGRMSCFSFQESKNMATGEGGIVLTNSKKLDAQARIVRHIGMRNKYEYVTLGYNYRLPALSAAVGLAQLRKLDAFNRHRARMAGIYRKELDGLPVSFIVEPAGYSSANHLFPVVLDVKFKSHMAGIIDALLAENAPAWWVYPEPIYNVPFFGKRQAYKNECPFSCPLRGNKYVYKKNECPNAEDIAARTIVLPTAPCYPESVARAVSKAMRKVLPYFYK